MRLTTVRENNMQQHATNDKQMLCVLGKKFGSFDRGFNLHPCKLDTWLANERLSNLLNFKKFK